MSGARTMVWLRIIHTHFVVFCSAIVRLFGIKTSTRRSCAIQYTQISSTAALYLSPFDITILEVESHLPLLFSFSFILTDKMLRVSTPDKSFDIMCQGQTVLGSLLWLDRY